MIVLFRTKYQLTKTQAYSHSVSKEITFLVRLWERKVLQQCYQFQRSVTNNILLLEFLRYVEYQSPDFNI